MPGRLTPLVNGEIYHVFNRGNNRQPTFISKRDFSRAIQTLKFYNFSSVGIKLSSFLRFDWERQLGILNKLDKGGKLVQIFSYCLMPNHFHFLVKQVEEKGISKFLGNFQNSYTRYFNTSHKRDGALFLDQFKAVRIETEDQFIHVLRYIHLNPYSSFVIKTKEEIEEYPWSSFKDYLGVGDGITETDLAMNFFDSTGKFKRFTLDQADYQRSLKAIQHLVLE